MVSIKLIYANCCCFFLMQIVVTSILYIYIPIYQIRTRSGGSSIQSGVDLQRLALVIDKWEENPSDDYLKFLPVWV